MLYFFFCFLFPLLCFCKSTRCSDPHIAFFQKIIFASSAKLMGLLFAYVHWFTLNWYISMNSIFIPSIIFDTINSVNTFLESWLYFLWHIRFCGRWISLVRWHFHVDFCNYRSTLRTEITSFSYTKTKWDRRIVSLTNFWNQ